MSRHRYAILCLAHRPTKDGGNLIDTFMAFMEAVSLAEARGLAVEVAHRRWPKAKGWTGHNFDATSCAAPVMTIEEIKEADQ